MRELLDSVARRAGRYLEDVRERRVGPSADDVNALSAFVEPMPDAPTDPAAVLDLLDSVGSPATVGMAGPRFFGFVSGGSLPAALAASWLASAWDQNPGLSIASPTATRLEEVSLSWLLDVLGLPAGSGA